MPSEVIVVGAGIVGLSTAIHLAKRGKSVLLFDRREPGRGTSFGNAGIIQCEGVLPYRFPRSSRDLLRLMSNKSAAVHFSLSALPQLAIPLYKYWKNSSPDRYGRIVTQYAPFVLAAAAEHDELSAASQVPHLIRKHGWIKLFRSSRSLAIATKEAEAVQKEFGIRHQALDMAALKKIEPALDVLASGAIQWVDSPTISDPGALLDAYASLFKKLGGVIARGDAFTLKQAQSGSWTIRSDDGQTQAAEVVLALGPASAPLTRQLGYRFPLFEKRGYHMHYGFDATLENLIVDADKGYLLAPMARGIRLTTGIEFARAGSPPTPVQLQQAEVIARQMFPLASRLDAQPWMGARPCTPDMKPIVGAAPRHKGLWFAFGHAHHGLTLGPLTGRLLAEAIAGERPLLDLGPLSPDRFRP